MTTTFQDKVNEVVASMTQADDGNWAIPESVEATEEVRFAAGLEKRRRDTQSAFAKSQTEITRLKAERDQFAQGWEADFAKSLTIQQQAELEELKATDPDAWRQKLNEYEHGQREAFKGKTAEIATKASQETEAEYRIRAFKEWSERNPTLQLTDDVIKSEVPPRITRELEEGKVSFEEFLDTCAEYLQKVKVLQTVEKAPAQPNLSSTPGGSAPSEEALHKANTNEYKHEIF